MKNKSCGTCRYYHPIARPENDIEYGYCQRFPPISRGDCKGNYKAAWPYIEENDWCGEWNEKEKA